MISKFIKKGVYLSRIIFGYYFLAFLLYILLYGLGFNLNNKNLIYGITIFVDLFFLFIILRSGYLEKLKLDFTKKFCFYDLVYILFGLILSFCSNCLYQTLVKKFSIQVIANSNLTPNFNPLYVILAVFVAPIFEEFFCRGYVYDSKFGKLSPFLGVTLSTSVFMMMHMTIYHLVVCFFLGMYLGFLRYRYNNLRLTILIHMSINIMSLFVMYNYEYFRYLYDNYFYFSLWILFVFIIVFYINCWSRFFNKK